MTDELCDVVGAGTCGPLGPLMLSVDLWVRPGKPNELGRKLKKRPQRCCCGLHYIGLTLIERYNCTSVHPVSLDTSGHPWR